MHNQLEFDWLAIERIGQAIYRPVEKSAMIESDDDIAVML
jgi:hypothetical protein